MSEEEIDQELVEDLRKSKEKLGALAPVVLDKHGNIVEGHHRLKADPNWPKITFDQIETEEDRILYTIAFNWHRREKSEKWKAVMLSKLAKLGYDVKKIIEKTGLSERTVYRYLPSTFKQSEPEQLASAKLALNRVSEETKVPSVTSQLVECEHCHVHSRDCKPWRGHNLCSKCFEEAESNPKRYVAYFDFFKTKPVVKPETWKPDTAKESWAFREARMKPQVSAFEVKFDVEAVKAGLPYGESHVPVCVRETVPDKTYQLPKGVLHVFFDGKTVHEGHEDRDEALRDVLRKRGETVLSITYERVTEEALQSAVEQVRAELLRLGWTPKQQQEA